MPPMVTTSFIIIPSSINLSTIAFDPKAVASTNALKIFGAVVPKDRSVTTPFNFWSAKGLFKIIVV